MRAILVDDEALALDVLEAALSSYKDIKIEGSYTDPKDALHNMETTKPDVIFLDIEMGSVNGLIIAEDFIEKNDSVDIVFVTAYSQYAIEAFEINAIDYLLKPIQQNRLDKTIKRLRNKSSNNRKVKKFEDVLKVECFGKLEVRNGSGQTLNWRTQKSKEVFVYLLVQKDKQALKDVIMETLFPEKELEKANTLLHTTIYQLRKNLKDLGFNKGITLKNGWYRLSMPVETDFEELKKLLILNEHNDKDIKSIVNIYKGDFLEYEGYNWLYGIQHNYKERTFKVLDKFIKSRLNQNQFSIYLMKALQLMFKIEPYDENENTAKNIIEYFGKQEQLGKMELFYEKYKDKLMEEFEVEPLKSTEKMFEYYYE